MTKSRKVNQQISLGAELAHQLRNPLTALNLQLEEIVEESTQIQIRDISQNAINQLEKIRSLVDRSLTIWRCTIEQDLVEVSVGELIAEIKKYWESKFKQSDRELKISGNLDLYFLGAIGIELASMSVVIENALQHGQGETLIEVSSDRNFVYFQIQDQGLGVNESIQSEIMQSGVTTSGNGIGLAWAKKQLITIGGQLEVTSMQPAIFKLSFLSSSNSF